tara:strand:+ start:13 stop:489 length:477 start_codon:yes stop_codon:yes gene_type:complete
MFRKLLITSFLLLSFTAIVYPSKKENTKLYDFCYSLEKIISRNSLNKRENFSGKIKEISKDIVKLGINQTQGTLINEIIDQYKSTKDSFIINLFPNKFYCLLGYWTENIKPGTFESIFYEKSKKTINEFKDFKYEVDEFFKDVNSEYESLKKEFESLF